MFFWNPNGQSDIYVNLESSRQASNLVQRLLQTWPDMSHLA